MKQNIEKKEIEEQINNLDCRISFLQKMINELDGKVRRIQIESEHFHSMNELFKNEILALKKSSFKESIKFGAISGVIYAILVLIINYIFK
jgi:hypothetical protein